MTSPSQLFEGHRLESNGQIAPVYDGVKVDTWAVGITLHILLRGNYPFDGLAEGLALTVSGDLSKTLIRKLKSSVTVSPDCLDFITQCLTFDSTARPTVHELLAHKWLEGCNEVVRIALLCRFHTSVLTRWPPPSRLPDHPRWWTPPCFSTSMTSSPASNRACREPQRPRCAWPRRRLHRPADHTRGHATDNFLGVLATAIQLVLKRKATRPRAR